MDVTYTDRARQSGKGFDLLQQASKQLEQVVGPAAARAKAEWDRIEDEKGHPLYSLRVSDRGASAQGQFTLEQFRFPTYVELRLSQVWGDLLQVLSDAQGRKVQELIAQLDEE